MGQIGRRLQSMEGVDLLHEIPGQSRIVQRTRRSFNKVQQQCPPVGADASESSGPYRLVGQPAVHPSLSGQVVAHRGQRRSSRVHPQELLSPVFQSHHPRLAGGTPRNTVGIRHPLAAALFDPLQQIGFQPAHPNRVSLLVAHLSFGVYAQNFVFPPGFFDRADPSPDHFFYAPPRLVTHIDDQAIAAVGDHLPGVGPDWRSTRLDVVVDLTFHRPAKTARGSRNEPG